MKKIIALIFSFFFLFSNVLADDLAKHARSAILIDASSGEILFEKESDTRYAPASMTKLMSMLIIMEKIDEGKISLDDDVVVTKNAADMGGSQVYLKEGESYKVRELLKGVAVASGNDAVVALAEKIGGSVSGFVDMMNQKVKLLGLSNTNFINPHGLDTDNHYSSSKDMAIIAKELLKHEKILEFTGIYEDYLIRNNGEKTWLVNTNKLVRYYAGADGLKTGYTKNALYCLTATAKRNNLRLIAVVMGEEKTEFRSEDVVSMLDYGFNTYKNKLILKAGDIVSNIKVKKGKETKVNLVTVNNIELLQKIMEENHEYHFETDTNELYAPIKKGDIAGKGKLFDENNNFIQEFDLTVDEDVLKANIFDYLKYNLKTILG